MVHAFVRACEQLLNPLNINFLCYTYLRETDSRKNRKFMYTCMKLIRKNEKYDEKSERIFSHFPSHIAWLPSDGSVSKKKKNIRK